MECNRDEALRAKELAEKKYAEKDFLGAKKFALKAQKLYPELDGVSQMLMTFDVYICSENRVTSGEVNWYSVLGVTPFADDDTIRKQYRKLALLLHPDKNKTPGADGAFKLVSEAWSLLSDKARRAAYNQKANVTGLQQRASSHTTVSSVSLNANGSHCSSGARTESKHASNPSSRKPKTFWTICSHCKTHYEYMRVYLNHNLRCPNCNEAFLATEMDPPSNLLKTANNASRQKHHNTKHYASGQQVQHNHFSGMTGHAAQADQQAHQQFKREHEEDSSSHRIERFFKKRRPDETCRFHNAADLRNPMGQGDGRTNFQNVYQPSKGYSGMEKVYGYYGMSSKPNSCKELSPFEIRNMLVTKASKDIQKILHEPSQGTEKEKRKHKGAIEKGTRNNHGHEDAALMKDESESKQFVSSDILCKGVPASASVITVPDSDFHNFDMDRTESAFADDQVWAAYDDNDGMPRYYARIQKVLSLKPFRLKISWLNSRNNMEFSSLEWVGSGFLKTCGDFRTGRYETTETLNAFSHVVKWTKGMRGIIRILPRKGDVWALYRNWSHDWSDSTPHDVIHQYDVVEVADDYSEGISVIPLVKVPGFKTVFQKHGDPGAVRWIPREEMFRFSHQVPGYLHTGNEAHNAPKGCRELDPAAIPLEFLQVVAEASEAMEVEISAKAKGGIEQNLSDFKADPISRSGHSTDPNDESESIGWNEQSIDNKTGT